MAFLNSFQESITSKQRGKHYVIVVLCSYLTIGQIKIQQTPMKYLHIIVILEVSKLNKAFTNLCPKDYFHESTITLTS